MFDTVPTQFVSVPLPMAPQIGFRSRHAAGDSERGGRRYRARGMRT
jgi:hypothetical protein